jgi:lipoprotein NlpI
MPREAQMHLVLQNAVFVALIGMTVHSIPSAQAQDALLKAQIASKKGDSAEAEKLLSSHIEKFPEDPTGYYLRGRERFRQAKIKESVADFDQVVKQSPAREKQLWERGISQYYAGDYARGAKQFELYQTYHDADVENAAWRYLCQAKATDVKTAKRDLLPIKGDERPVLMDIYAMFKEEKTPSEVISIAEKVNGDETDKKMAMFYAQLYVGIYYEALGEDKKSLEHIRLAAEKYNDDHYMGDVAKVHLKLRADSKKAP